MRNVKVTLTKEQVSNCIEIANRRFNSNRKANNPTDIKTPVYDIVGAKGELALVLMVGADEQEFYDNAVINQKEFSKNKNNIFDVAGQYEVRASEYKTAHLIIKEEDVRSKPMAKFILITIAKDGTCAACGWMFAYEAVKTKYSKKDSYTSFKQHYWVPQKDLRTMDTLINTNNDSMVGA